MEKKKSKGKSFFKFIGIFLLVIVLIIALLAGTGAIYYAASRDCSLNIKIDETKEEQEIYGWGSSDCWWSDDISDETTRDEMAKLLYSKDGLNLNIYRYCLYGGYDENNNDVENEWRLGESFYYFNEKDNKYEYDWSRDKNSQEMLNTALSLGNIDTVVLFANSPHYSMCINGKTSGATTNGGWDTNLDESQYQNYVDYFLTITEHFVSEGIPVKFISPINEPQWGWGGETPIQEGCHYEPEQIVEIYKLFAKGIKDRGLDVKLYAPESGNIGDTTKNYWNLLSNDEDILPVLGAFTYHSYFADTDKTKKTKFGKWAKDNVNIRFDMSEWCELPTAYATTDPRSAIAMANVIANDMSETKVNSWSSWVSENQNGISEEDGLNYSDGLFSTDPEDTSKYEIAYRYYAYKQFSSFVPVGSTMIDVKDGVYTLVKSKDDDGYHFDELVNESAFKTPDGNIVLVVVNRGNERNIKINMNDYSNVSIYTTDKDNKCNETYNGQLESSYSVTENSVNTFVFSK